jgi:dihydrofolate synthase/folylpolyglutamate synthase
LHPRVIDLSLARIERLLERLGHPERQLAPVIHVAGTNGKGSTVAFLKAMLEAHGFVVHAYTSPHLVRFNERIVVAGREIDDDTLSSLLQECEEANAGDPITFFEVTTAAAFLAFARTPADFTLLETGLGGRLDATNVIARPLITALTPISLDHQAFLGETIAEVAGEKAGILKARVLCFSAHQLAAAAAVITRRAAEVGAPLISEGEGWSAKPEGDGWRFEGFAPALPQTHLSLPAPALAGAHQIANAGLALACLYRLPGLTIDTGAIASGLARARWPARLQRLDQGRLVDLLPAGWELWLDGGHNPGAAQVLARHLAGWRDRPLVLVFAMLKTKDNTGFLAPLAGLAQRALTVAIPGEAASLDADSAAAAARRVGLAAEACESVHDALCRAAGSGEPSARVLICGSLYLAGAVLAENG